MVFQSFISTEQCSGKPIKTKFMESNFGKIILLSLILGAALFISTKDILKRQKKQQEVERVELKKIYFDYLDIKIKIAYARCINDTFLEKNGKIALKENLSELKEKRVIFYIRDAKDSAIAKTVDSVLVLN